NTRLVAAMLPEATIIDSIDAVEPTCATGLYLFDPRRFLETVEPHLPGEALPIGWQTTSDSIAARVARVLTAGELVLLKSAPPDARWWPSTAAERGYVDKHFPVAAAGLVVRCVDLRAADVDEETRLTKQ